MLAKGRVLRAIMAVLFVIAVYLAPSRCHAAEQVFNIDYFGNVEDFEPGTGTMCHNRCNGHGMCVSNGNGAYCSCDLGWGSADDITEFRDPSCRLRTCPAGDAWASAAIARGGSNEGLTTSHEMRECSNIGLCDRSSGKCRCPKGYHGGACERRGCLGSEDCSGHGRCMSMRRLARQKGALPLSGHNPPTNGNNDTYMAEIGLAIGDGALFKNGSYVSEKLAWDADKIFGCLCDSSWVVGLGSGETQQPEWFGPACSMKRCPSGDDPMTAGLDTNCNGT